MADHHRRSDEQITQEQTLIDDPNFLKEIVRMALQRFLVHDQETFWAMD